MQQTLHSQGYGWFRNSLLPKQQLTGSFVLTDCTDSSCLLCCRDDRCVVHKEIRAKAQWKQDVLNRCTPIHRMAKSKKSQQIRDGAFREKGFVYMGQTIQIWNIREYMRNPKWKEDAVRKSKRRLGEGSCRAAQVAGNAKRFRKVLEDWRVAQAHTSNGRPANGSCPAELRESSG